MGGSTVGRKKTTVSLTQSKGVLGGTTRHILTPAFGDGCAAAVSSAVGFGPGARVQGLCQRRRRQPLLLRPLPACLAAIRQRAPESFTNSCRSLVLSFPGCLSILEQRQPVTLQSYCTPGMIARLVSCYFLVSPAMCQLVVGGNDDAFVQCYSCNHASFRRGLCEPWIVIHVGSL